MAKRKLDDFLNDEDFSADLNIDEGFVIGGGQAQEGFLDENYPPEDPSYNAFGDKYRLDSIIGHGGYGVVWRAEEWESGNFVALKCINGDAEGLTSYITETTVLKQLNHQNVVKLLDNMRYRDTLIISLELHPMTLAEHIEELSALKLEETRKLLRGLLQALEYCHSKSILHLDIKPSNVLISGEGEAKLADFGLAIKLPSNSLPQPNEVATLSYRAPELLLGSAAITKSVDMWSVGCTLAEMLTGKLAFKGNFQIKVIFEIFRFVGTPSETHLLELTLLPYYKNAFPRWRPAKRGNNLLVIDEKTEHLLKRILEPVPSRRITASEALQHAFLVGQVQNIN